MVPLLCAAVSHRLDPGGRGPQGGALARAAFHAQVAANQLEPFLHAGQPIAICACCCPLPDGSGIKATAVVMNKQAGLLLIKVEVNLHLCRVSMLLNVGEALL